MGGVGVSFEWLGALEMDGRVKRSGREGKREGRGRRGFYYWVWGVLFRLARWGVVLLLRKTNPRTV